MISFAFIFFLVVFIINYSRRGLDVYTYMVLLFVVISFFSIIMDAMDLYSTFGTPHRSLGIIAPLFYCGLLYSCMKPYKRFNSNLIEKIEGINEKRYDKVVYLFFCVFLVILSASIARIDEIVASQNLAMMRDDFYHGNDVNVWSTYSGYMRIFMAVLSLWGGCSNIMILFFFVNIVCLHKPLWFNIITLLGATTPLLLSLFIMDRSGFVHWFLLFGLFGVLFHKQIHKKDLKNFYIIGGPVLALMFLYFYSVTVSRFGDDTGGNTIDGIVFYAGQSYIYFCRFFNDLGPDAPFSLAELFPYTYSQLGLPSYFEQCQIVRNYCHYGITAFSTFLGIILSMSGKIVLLIFVFLYTKFASSAVARPFYNIITFKKLTTFFIFAIVIVNGLFGYCYMGFMSSIYILSWYFLGRFISKNTTL